MKTRIVLLAVALLSMLPSWAFRADTLSFNSRYVPDTEKVTVLVPTTRDGAERFPTVYVLNGFGGDHKSWTNITVPNMGELADRYGMIFVMPDGRDSWYWDSPADPSMKMESFITKELVPAVDAKYPTLPTRDKRAITGLSMGGQGSLYLATRHPEIFGNAGSMSGGVDIRPFPRSWKMAKWLGTYDENKDLWDKTAVVNMVDQMKGANINIIFDCGVDDFFAEVNNNLHQAMLAAGIPHDYTSRPGKHTHDYWRNSFLYHLLFFNQNFTAKK